MIVLSNVKRINIKLQCNYNFTICHFADVIIMQTQGSLQYRACSDSFEMNHGKISHQNNST